MKESETPLILGLDPGTAATGWGLLRSGDGGFVTGGVIRPPRGGSPAAGLAFIARAIAQLLTRHRVESAAVEEVFVARYPRAALRLGEARGVCLAELARHHVPLSSYAPRFVKQAVTGCGTADKAAIALMMRRHGAADDLAEDAMDALAVAWCHFLHGRSPMRRLRIAR